MKQHMHHYESALRLARRMRRNARASAWSRRFEHWPRFERWRRSDPVFLPDRGAVTAEYAVIIMAAVAFAGLLVAIMQSSEVRQLLVDLVQRALGSAG